MMKSEWLTFTKSVNLILFEEEQTMNKQEFLAELKQQLSLKMNHDEVTSTVEYYEGYINEAIDFGLSEEEALKQLGDIETIVNEVVNGLEDEHIDISKHEIVGQVEQVQSIEAMLRRNITYC